MIRTLLFLAPGEAKHGWQRALAAQLPDVALRYWPEIGDPAAIDAALVWRPPAGLLATLPNLRLIHALGAGVDHLFSDPLFPEEVPLVRLVDPDMTVSMSEYVLLQVLRLHRQDLTYLAQQRDGQWRPHRQPTADQRRVGVLGLGVLGSEAALRLKVLGFDVAGWSRGEKRLPGIACFWGVDGLAALLARSEILVSLLPLTPETADILDARLFAALPQGAAIVSCGRGGHLVEADLLAALDSGQLSAAVLDVFREEPLPRGHAFWGHPRVVVTPHAAALTNPDTAALLIAEAVRCHDAGKPVPHLVDHARRY